MSQDTLNEQGYCFAFAEIPKHVSTAAALMVFFAMALLGIGPPLWSQTGDIPVSIVVSLKARHGNQIPAVYREDVRVFEDHQRMRVAEWVPLQDEQAGLELFMVIDDAISPTIGLQFEDLRTFMIQQPPTTKIALGYMHFGAVDMVQELTSDHERAAKALRLPMATGGQSPYAALTEMMDRWDEGANRRVIFLISPGIDALQPGPNNMYLDEAIQKAQRTGTQIYSIYAGAVGQFGQAEMQFTWGQNNLLQLADETGGDAYLQGLATPISFGPYLNEFAARLTHQFKLTFLAGGKKSGLKRIKLETEVPNVELEAATRVYVPVR